MKFSAALALAAAAVGVQGQGVPSGIAPAGGSPAGCITTGNGYYQITVVQLAQAAKRDLEKRDTCGSNALVFKLNGGVLTDKQGRIGSIVANRQFQFDGPPAQTGAIYTGGFSICGNTSLAIGPTTNFYQCSSGNFYNLYDRPSESNCTLVKFNTIPCTLDGATGSSSSAASSVVSSRTDGQPTASSAAVISTRSDGQPTASSAATVRPSTTSAPVVSQKSDGQPTASSAAVVTQISDGQPQASNASRPTSARPSAPLATGAAAHFGAAGAVAAIGAAAALLL